MNKIINKLKSHKLGILIFLLLYISNDTLLFGTNIEHSFLYLQYIFLLLLLLFLVLIFIKKKVKTKLIFFFTIYLALTLSTMVFKDLVSFKYFYEILLLFLALLITSLYDFETFTKEFISVIFIISLLSFIPFLINIIYQPILNVFPTLINISGYKYHNLFIGFVPHNFYTFNIFRNMSFFREPGIYGCFLNVALLLLLFSKKENNFIKKLFVIIIATLTTMSTGSILCMLFILSIYLVIVKFNRKKILLLIVLICFGLLFRNSDYLNQVVFGKLNTINSSYYSRLASVTSNSKIIVEEPILGIGWERIVDKFESISVFKYESSISHGEKKYHNTNTFFKMGAIHGILFLGLYIIGFYKFVGKLTSNKFLSILLLLSFILIFSYEDLTLNIFLPIIMFYGHLQEKEGKKYENS